MTNLTTVGLTAGAGSSGTGTVSTLDNVIGVAGTPSAQVQTVQGVTSMTPLKVDGSAVTQPVSMASTTITGTAAVTQSGTWTVQPGNTPNTTAWKVDGSAVTQPVSLATNTPTIATGTNTIGSVKITDGTSIPTVKAASTAPIATDTALVVAISPNSVNANGQATMANSAPVVLSSGQTFSGQNQTSPTNQIAVGGQFNTTPTTITTGNVSPLQLDSAGNLLVNIKTGASSGAVAQGSTTSGQTGSLIQGAVTTSAPSYTTAQTSPLSLDTSGNLRVNVVAGGSSTTTNTPVTPATATATNGTLVGGQYNSTVQAFTNGQQGSIQLDQRGGLLIQDGQVLGPFSVTSSTTMFTVTDTSGYSSISIQVVSAGSGNYNIEGSDDGTTWVAIIGRSISGTPAVGLVNAITGQYVFPITAKQFRVRVSSYSSGTCTVLATLRKDIVAPNVIYGGANIDNASVNNSMPISYESRTTNKATVTSGFAVHPIATSIGAAVVKPYQIPELDWSFVAAAGGITNTTTAVTLVAAAGSGIRNYLTGIQLSNSTLGTGGEIAVRDGASGTVIWRGVLATGASDPVQITFPTPIRGTANTLMEFVTLTASVTGAVYVNAQGYQAP